VKFLRQLAAVVVVVAVVVLIGLAWSHLAPSLPGEGRAGQSFVVRGQVVNGRPPPGGKPPSGATPKLPGGATPGIVRNTSGSGIPSLLLGDLLKPANLVVLRNNAVLEVVVIAAVVYRRLRRARRARTSLPR
jgi:hypothetical protein